MATRGGPQRAHRCHANSRFRRVSPIAPRPREGLLTELRRTLNPGRGTVLTSPDIALEYLAVLAPSDLFRVRAGAVTGVVERATLRQL